MLRGSGPTPRTRDFSLGKYDELCGTLRDAGYVARSLGDHLAGAGEAVSKLVLLRHDVESSAAQAEEMAVVERRHGLVASYFFRTKRRVLVPERIRRIAAMGHEIGYHYETLGQARGDLDRAVALFGQSLARLRELAPVRVASMHGSPLYPWDNRGIWARVNPADFGLVGEVYLDLDYRSVQYFSDTGRTWHPTRYNVRDRPAVLPEHLVEGTDELMDLVRSGAVPRLCLLTHPERWPRGGLAWGLRAARDRFENLAKLALARAYDLVH